MNMLVNSNPFIVLGIISLVLTGYSLAEVEILAYMVLYSSASGGCSQSCSTKASSRSFWVGFREGEGYTGKD